MDKASEPPSTVNKDDTVATSTEKKPEPVEEFPDPDEDDLDDLDDMLNEFSSVKIDSKKATDSTSAVKPEPAAAPAAKLEAPDPDISEDELAKQLQAGMADFLNEFGKSPDMQAQFEDMFKQMTQAADSEMPQDSPATASGDKVAAETAAAAADLGKDASFQDTIRRTMERMQNSGDQATSAAAASGGEDDFMSELLKQMSSGDFSGEGSEEEFSKMLMGMMEQLTSKEILYEPMKELDDKFPAWLEKNRSTTSAEDLKRYEEQQAVAREIVAKFEEKTYADSNAADREYIVERMQKMQASGSPPTDLVGDMPSAQEAFNAPDEQCNPQ